ncbi:ABC transporter ATP-binding protein [Ferviditalea candida]|uniref:ABC transporter ATP-binding protein n=1 Tax=Ferviditalea candida TaxID=3108399 RepID=A0ABU5ZDQ6_9BACL|nr:ABC transporter ATP-binding protein [Paenibacillaceae bacterium T2]
MQPILEVKDLHVSFGAGGDEVHAVRGVSFHVNRGEAVGIVGESGNGKSVTAQALMRLIPIPSGKIKQGTVTFGDQDLLSLTEKEMESIRGREIGMVFQDPAASLNPTMTVGRQIAEGLIKHGHLNPGEARDRTMEMLTAVGIANPEVRFKQYPHELSGGMKQRVNLAIAAACNPSLLIADEPTSALDVTVQAQILQLMKDLQQRLNISILLITHDLSVVAALCDRVLVMYAGKIVETGTKREILENPQHPYTKALLRSIPRLEQNKDEPLMPIFGNPPDMSRLSAGCEFCGRCEQAMNICERSEPDMFDLSITHQAKCWLHHPLAQARGMA